MKLKVAEAEALGHGQTVAFEANEDERFTALEKEDKVDRLLADLKARTVKGLLS